MNQPSEDIRENRDKKVAGAFKYLNIIMGAVYVIIGLFFFFSPFVLNMSVFTKSTISILIVAYGCFRLYRALKS